MVFVIHITITDTGIKINDVKINTFEQSNDSI